MSMVLFLGQSLTNPAVGAGGAVVTNATPFAPGRNAVAKVSAFTAGQIVIETAVRTDPTFTSPTTLATFNPTSPTTQEVAPLDYYVRYRVTQAVTNTGAGSIHLEGVQ